MAVKTEKDLPESHRATWLKSLSAMQLKNYGYVIQLMQGVLKAEPDFLPADSSFARPRSPRPPHRARRACSPAAGSRR